MKRKCKFEKWRDPLNSDIEEVEWPGFNLDKDGDEVPVYAAKSQSVLNTPFGMLSVMGHTMAVNQFDFWVMHTNFDITNTIRDMISTVPGVETLEIYTRYRARIGFTKSGFFDSGRVMASIQAAISNIQKDQQNQLLLGLPNEIAQSAINMRDKIDSQHDNWAILILPNGHIEALISDIADNAYLEKLQILTTTKESVGGRLLTSEV